MTQSHLNQIMICMTLSHYKHIHRQSRYCLYSSRRTNYPRGLENFTRQRKIFFFTEKLFTLVYHKKCYLLTWERNAKLWLVSYVSNTDRDYPNTHRDYFLIVYFVCTSNTSWNHWRLQHYQPPNGFPTTKVASFQVKESKTGINYKLRFYIYIVVSLSESTVVLSM